MLEKALKSKEMTSNYVIRPLLHLKLHLKYSRKNNTISIEVWRTYELIYDH